MATSPYVEIILNGKKLIGPVNLPGKEGTFEIFEFYHQISAVGENEFTGEIVREHKSIEFVKAVDCLSTTLYKVLTLNKIIDKVIINWYRHSEKTNRDEVYFQHILENVKVTGIKMYMPNVKDKRYERFPHLERVALRYDWITFHCPDGNRTFKEQWAFAFLLFGMNKMKYAEDEKALTSSAVSDEMIDDEPNVKLDIKNLRWEHTDEQLKKDSPDTASEGDTIKLLADFENYIDGAGVDFFVSDKSSGTKKQLKKIHTRCNKMAAEVEWEVYISKAGEEPDIIFEVEARSLLKGPCEIKIEEREEITKGFCNIQFVDWKNDKIKDISCKITRDDEEIFNEKLSDGAFVLKNVPDIKLKAHVTYKDKPYLFVLPWTLSNDMISLIKIMDNFN